MADPTAVHWAHHWDSLKALHWVGNWADQKAGWRGGWTDELLVRRMADQLAGRLVPHWDHSKAQKKVAQMANGSVEKKEFQRVRRMAEPMARQLVDQMAQR